MDDMTPPEGAMAPEDKELDVAMDDPTIGGRTLVVTMIVVVPPGTEGRAS